MCFGDNCQKLNCYFPCHRYAINRSNSVSLLTRNSSQHRIKDYGVSLLAEISECRIPTPLVDTYFPQEIVVISVVQYWIIFISNPVLFRMGKFVMAIAQRKDINAWFFSAGDRA